MGAVQRGSLVETDAASFVRKPIGRYVRGPGVAVWCFSERLMGASVTGRVGPDDLAIFLETNALARRLQAFDSVLDAHQHTGFSPGTMQRWFAHGLDYITAARGRLRRNVCVLPRGFELRVAVAGAVRLAPIPWEQHVVLHLREAFERLGYQSKATALAAEVRRLTRQTHLQSVAALSRREHEVATLAASGLSDLNIGQALGISETTVGSHMARVFRKLKVHSRVDLANAFRRGERSSTPW